jgi:hypothetical protein
VVGRAIVATGKSFRILIVLFSFGGLLLQMLAASAQSASNSQKPISHPTICREWGNVAMGVYARYQTKYRTVFALLASQARDEEADAHSKGWSETNVRLLLEIVSNAQSGRWSNVEKFGEDEFNDCIQRWKATTTPEQRAAEGKAVEAYNAGVIANKEKFEANVARTATCQQYQSVAIELITLQRTGVSYKRAAEVAASKAYGPGGQVLRHSEENADYFMMLAAAVYFARDKYGMNDQTFMARAFNGCMRGELLDASVK